jgi:ferredoxin
VVDDTTRGDTVPSGTKVVVVDREACMGSGNCVYWAPNVFDLDDDGIAIVLGDPAGNAELVRVALENCPTSAIRLAGG